MCQLAFTLVPINTLNKTKELYYLHKVVHVLLQPWLDLPELMILLRLYLFNLVCLTEHLIHHKFPIESTEHIQEVLCLDDVNWETRSRESPLYLLVYIFKVELVKLKVHLRFIKILYLTFASRIFFGLGFKLFHRRGFLVYCLVVYLDYILG